MAHHSRRRRPAKAHWLQSIEGLRMTVWLLLAYNFLRDLPAAIDSPNVLTVGRLAPVLAILAVMLLPPPRPTDPPQDQTAG